MLASLAFACLAAAALQVPSLYAASQQNEPGNSRSASLNWAGYVANDPGTYTSVTGSWVVPTVSRGMVGTADATWVGIGGVQSDDLIQAGTQAIAGRSGEASYQAWFEILPHVSMPVDLAVSPGDSMTTTITEESPDNWNIVIHNNTTGKQYEKTVAYRSSKSSAEWVEERVSSLDGSFYPLDNFSAVNFTNALAMKDGQLLQLSQLDAKPLTMVSGSGQILASASKLDEHGQFSVSRTAGNTTAPIVYDTPSPEPQVSAVSPDTQFIVVTIGPDGITVNTAPDGNADATSSGSENSDVPVVVGRHHRSAYYSMDPFGLNFVHVLWR